MSPRGLKGEDDLMSVSMESCEGEVAREVEGESSRDSELPLTFIHSITVVPVAVLEPDKDLWKKGRKTIKKELIAKGKTKLLASNTNFKLHTKYSF